MRITTTDAMTGNEVRDTANAPWQPQEHVGHGGQAPG
jgi:hypothetical protein